MTCIVALAGGSTVYMGGDSAASDETGIVGYTLPKIWRFGDFVMGSCDSFRMADILRYKFIPPPQPKTSDELDEYMRTRFIDQLISVFRSNSFLWEKDGAIGGGTILVGIRGRIFRIDDDFHVGESGEGFDAIGSGAPYALGSLFTSTEKPTERVDLALQSAGRFDAGVRGPYYILSTGD